MKQFRRNLSAKAEGAEQAKQEARRLLMKLFENVVNQKKAGDLKLRCCKCRQPQRLPSYTRAANSKRNHAGTAAMARTNHHSAARARQPDWQLTANLANKRASAAGHAQAAGEVGEVAIENILLRLPQDEVQPVPAGHGADLIRLFVKEWKLERLSLR